MLRQLRAGPILFACVLLVLLILQPGHAEAAREPAFVQVADGQLTLGGVALRLVGVNSFGLLSDYLGVGQVSPPNSAQKINDLTQARGRVMRFWTDIAPSDFWFGRAYEVWTRDADHRTYLNGLRALISDLSAHGMLAVPVLASYPEGWTQRASGSFWSVGSPANLQWKEWVRSIVTDLRDEPAILAWELANEANFWATSAGGCRGGCASIDQLVSWAKDAHAYVKALDANHLVEGGWNNPGEIDTTLFKRLNADMDIANLHIYAEDLYTFVLGLNTRDKQETDAYISRFAQAAEEMGKPLMVGEFGANLRDNPQARYINDLLASVFEFNGAVALLWSWEDGSSEFSVYLNNTYQVNVLATWSTQFELDAMRSSLAGLSERLASLGEQISGFSAELDSVERDLRAGMTAIAQELEATRALQARIDLLESQTAGVRKSLEELRGEVDAVREGIDLANQEAASVNQAVGRTNASIQQLYVLLIAVGISTPSLVAILLFLFRRRLRH